MKGTVCVSVSFTCADGHDDSVHSLHNLWLGVLSHIRVVSLKYWIAEHHRSRERGIMMLRVVRVRFDLRPCSFILIHVPYSYTIN